MLAAISARQSVCAEILDHPRSLFGNPYLVIEFRGDAVYRFEITASLIFRQIGLKISFHTPKIFLVDLTHK